MSKDVEMFAPDIYQDNGIVRTPNCRKCGTKMLDDGECSEGCCDDWKCPKCGYAFRSEAPD